ncbi:hypothetical protein D9619_005110 [Psilocybe cf. subviscida]|uniref:Nephrocystin 3-like N-terminal domain-containing protein n=1 Tax=Psilocybe cf. subviscida TaxID=2480587 RepID=A0A8H5F8T6_9AGAR|nr:hypothetical protein D9619_005110 [Psilocybe cf. subviscida]
MHYNYPVEWEKRCFDFGCSHCFSRLIRPHRPPPLSRRLRRGVNRAMSFFTDAHGVVVSGQNVTMTAYSCSQAADRGFDILCQNTTPAALYGSSASAKGDGCLHGARLDVQDYIFKWLDNPESEAVMWMHGPAGIGKTAIAKTVANLCAERGQLLSAFFFLRSDEGRNSMKHLVPSLAYAMVQQISHTRNIVCTSTANNPLIFSAPLERQIGAIIIPAFSNAFSPLGDSPPDPMLIVIDGLDECIDLGAQQLIIRSFVSLFATTTTVIGAKILIVSRPESHIVSTFSVVDIAQHVRQLRLDEWDTIADIEIFLRAELEEVRQTHPLKSYLDAGWPQDTSLKKLLHRSLESFIYSTLAIRYIASHSRHPQKSLNNLLALDSDCAYEAHAELDLLYCHILQSLDEKTRNTVRKILCLYTYLSIDDIETVGSLLGETTFAVELAVRRMSSVIYFEEPWNIFSYYHTSFRDYLLDKQRSGVLYLYSPDIANTVANSLSTIWIHPTTMDDYKLMRGSASVLPTISLRQICICIS